MKEIDFIPQWYTSGRRKKINNRLRLVVLCVIVTIGAAWDLTQSVKVQKRAAQLASFQQNQIEAENAINECNNLKTQIANLTVEARTLDQIDSKIDVAKVIAELSFIIDDKIALKKVDFNACKIKTKKTAKNGFGNTVRTSSMNPNQKNSQAYGPAIFKIKLSGIAKDAQNVAQLICSLEDSEYFTQVVPVFSRTNKIAAQSEPRSKTKEISEFEISCNLANYLDKSQFLAKK